MAHSEVLRGSDKVVRIETGRENVCFEWCYITRVFVDTVRYPKEMYYTNDVDEAKKTFSALFTKYRKELNVDVDGETIRGLRNLGIKATPLYRPIGYRDGVKVEYADKYGHSYTNIYHPNSIKNVENDVVDYIVRDLADYYMDLEVTKALFGIRA